MDAVSVSRGSVMETTTAVITAMKNQRTAKTVSQSNVYYVSSLYTRVHQLNEKYFIYLFLFHTTKIYISETIKR